MARHHSGRRGGWYTDETGVARFELPQVNRFVATEEAINGLGARVLELMKGVRPQLTLVGVRKLPFSTRTLEVPLPAEETAESISITTFSPPTIFPTFKSLLVCNVSADYGQNTSIDTRFVVEPGFTLIEPQFTPDTPEHQYRTAVALHHVELAERYAPEHPL